MHFSPKKYKNTTTIRDLCQETLSVLLIEKATVEENLNLAAEKLSNISHTLPRLLLMFCNIGDYWQRGDYVFRQKLQKIMFPEGVSFDKNTGDYRTFSANPVAELIACIVATYTNGQTKSDCDFTHQSLDVEKRRLERPTPTSRTWCATNCATSRRVFRRVPIKTRVFLSERRKSEAVYFATRNP